METCDFLTLVILPVLYQVVLALKPPPPSFYPSSMDIYCVRVLLITPH